MLDLALHKTILITVLKAIYGDPILRPLLGFKGGTAAYLFYDLPRMSVDLDFDLLDEEKKELVFDRVGEILKGMGELTMATEKRFTLFFLLNYQKGLRNLKVEISKRRAGAEYETKLYLGIPMSVVRKDYMMAGKLAALVTRKQFASRDMFDLYYFFKNHWKINEYALKEMTKYSVGKAITKAIERVKKIPGNQVLHGLGELVDVKQKPWLKENLQNELLFSLKLYAKTHQL